MCFAATSLLGLHIESFSHITRNVIIIFLFLFLYIYLFLFFLTIDINYYFGIGFYKHQGPKENKSTKINQ